jgi:hypothetical protein
MGNFAQSQSLAHLGPFGHQGHNAAVIGLEKSHEHQEGKHLMLGKVLAAAAAGIGGKGLFRDFQGLPGQRHRRPRHRSWSIHPPDIESLIS